MKNNYFFLLFCLFTSTTACAQNTIRAVKKIKINATIANGFAEKSGAENCTVNIENNTASDDKNILSFDGPSDAWSAQMDPQIAVGGNHVLQLNNGAAVVFNKQGELMQAVHLDCFTDSKFGIDPKVFYDIHNKYFGFSVYDYESKKDKKPIRFLLSKTNNPLGDWYRYNVPALDAVDGGSIGYGNKWLIYEYPTETKSVVLVMNAIEAKKGNVTNAYKFYASVGQPIFNQSNGKAYFIRTDMEHDKLVLHTIEEKDGAPIIKKLWAIENTSALQEMPPASAQKNAISKIASGDFNPKNAVMFNNSIWFCHAVNSEDFSAIEWMELNIKNGNIVQSGLISEVGTNFIHPTIGINNRGVVAIGFQETNENMYVSARCTYRMANDKLGTMRDIINIAEGNSAYKPLENKGTLPWGDYSGTIVDGDNGIDIWSAQTIMEDGKVKIIAFRIKL
jgi:hypothetical protein